MFLTKRHEEICVGFIEIALRDAMDSILRDRSKDDPVEIAEIVQNRMIDELQRLDYQVLIEREGWQKVARSNHDPLRPESSS